MVGQRCELRLSGLPPVQHQEGTNSLHSIEPHGLKGLQSPRISKQDSDMDKIKQAPAPTENNNKDHVEVSKATLQMQQASVLTRKLDNRRPPPPLSPCVGLVVATALQKDDVTVSGHFHPILRLSQNRAL